MLIYSFRVHGGVSSCLGTSRHIAVAQRLRNRLGWRLRDQARLRVRGQLFRVCARLRQLHGVVEVCLRNEKTANSALVDAIKEIARSRQMTRGDLVNAIEDERGQANLSSARGQYETSLISALPLTIGNASKPASLYFRTSY